jgi:regulator of nucleoside diphosphate kinase
MTHRSSTILSPNHFELLQQLMSTLIGSRSGFASILREKLGAAEVTPSDEIGPDVVTLGSVVEYRVEGSPGSAQVTLVRGLNSRDTLSVFDPRGLALLGLKSGESITIPSGNGSSETLVVEAVLDGDEMGSVGHPASSIVTYSPEGSRLGRRSTVRYDDDHGPRAA